MQQRWPATEKDAYAVYQSFLKFDLYLGGANCVLHCDHKPLEPFQSKSIQIPKLNRWSMELADCISRYYLQVENVKYLQEILENPKAQVANNTQICHSNNNSFKSLTLSASSILQKHWYVHSLQHDITIHHIMSTNYPAWVSWL